MKKIFRMKHKIFYKKTKYTIVKILLLIIFFNESAFTKPIPPGSGSGDVPVNVLFLLDNSLSMRRQIVPGDGVFSPWDLVELDSGDLVISQQQRMGVVKMNYGTGLRDGTFGYRGFFKGAKKDSDCSNKDSRIGDAWQMGIDRKDTNDNTDDLIYVMEHRKKKVVVLDVDGNCEDVIWLGFKPRNMTVRTFGNDTHLFTGGFWRHNNPHHYRFRTYNLTQGTNRWCDASGNKGRYAVQAWGIAVAGSAGTPNNLYAAWSGNIIEMPLTADANGLYCFGDETAIHTHDGGTSSTTRHPQAGQIEMDPDDDTLFYVSTWTNQIGKYEITGAGNNGLTEVWKRGTRSRSVTESDATVNFWGTRALFVGDGTTNKGNDNALLYVGSNKPTIQGFDKDHANGQWQKELGGTMETRMAGAKKAINAIVTDKTLTTGANFGYGHWSAGIPGVIGRHQAHKQKGSPDYYTSWSGTHPDGTSLPCWRGVCIRVGVGRLSADKIPNEVTRTPLIFGTDARAFSTMALDYYTDEVASPRNIGLDCQRNYVIVIGDGAWNGHDYAIDKIQDLRTLHGVRTLVVAYGGGINATGLNNFALMARAGSCNTLGDDDCEPAILADTPKSLMTQLESKIQQIVADRLSFTAPSITATIEEGGSLYQAQFNYAQNEEWKGTILRKAINNKGKVCEVGELDEDGEMVKLCPGNWSAAERMETVKTSRKIWTALPSAKYNVSGNQGWNNWTAGADESKDNSAGIATLFGLLNYDVIDYHRQTIDTSGSAIQKYCYDETGDSTIQDGNADDIKGLINFVRGKDYFNYKKTCSLTGYRDHILGDIYHSQLLQVGPANANTSFTGRNQESFWRASNGYGNYIVDQENRKTILYAGANDGMLHAFNACDKDDVDCLEGGKEIWAFVPPFIAAQLPTIVNIALNKQKNGGGTNSIFGVDGSPVVHDMYIETPHDSDTTLDSSGVSTTTSSGKKWRTILVAPYGRGGAGFSVLDVSDPIIEGGKGPLHLFSIYNDTINNKVLFANHEGHISEYPYMATNYSLDVSEEARRANDNIRNAETTDDNRGDGLTTEQDAIVDCQSEADVTDRDFAVNGTNACYEGKIWSWAMPDHEGTLEKKDITVTETTDAGTTNIEGFSVSDSSGFLTITFTSNKTYAAHTTDAVPTETSALSIAISRDKLATIEDSGDTKSKSYLKYSLLGETWSTPRIFRMPLNAEAGIDDDVYVMVMGGGMGSTYDGTGSNLFVISLEDQDDPGKIIEVIKIHDNPANGIGNSTPGSPVVITPDTTTGIPWRGALVYLNDLEGKITKFNLTNMKTDGAGNDVNLYDSTTIFDAGTNRDNGRYMFHSMDASIGRDTKRLWLYAGTGDYEDVNHVDKPEEPKMDNLLLGIKDKAFPYYRNVGNSGVTDVSELDECKNTTTNSSVVSGCPDSSDLGWRIHLSQGHNYNEKVTAEPTVYKGNVYFPIYRPNTEDVCDLGAAFICSADDECGTNISDELGANPADYSDSKCHYVGRGILSEIVVFADTLFANIAGLSEANTTLVIKKAAEGEADSYRRSWRENY